MKVLCEPSSGKIRDRVAYISPYGHCFRELVIPTNHRTEAQQFMREIFVTGYRETPAEGKNAPRQVTIHANLDDRLTGMTRS